MHLVKLYEEWKDRVEFLTIYIKEAHAVDGWELAHNHEGEKEICYLQPQTTESRISIACDFINHYSYPIPLLVDDIDNIACYRYSALPERLYIIEADGKIAHKGEVGPTGFDPTEVKDWLEKRFSS